MNQSLVAGLCPLVAGETDIDQLGRVIATFGSIEEAWPGVTEMPDYGKISFAHAEGFPLEELLPDASAGSVKLLGRLLQLDPGADYVVGQSHTCHGLEANAAQHARTYHWWELAKRRIQQHNVIHDAAPRVFAFHSFQMVSLHAWQMFVCAQSIFFVNICFMGDASGARCSAADSLLDDWFLSEPRPAETNQMQMFVQQTLTQQQAQLKHSIK